MIKINKLKYENQEKFKKLPIPTQYQKGVFVLLKTNRTFEKGIIESLPRQIKLYFVFDIKLETSEIKEVAYHDVIIVSKEVWDMKQPNICDVCNEWYDYNPIKPTPSICRKCFDKFEKSNKENCEHVQIEVPARVVNQIQWNCSHYIICKKCGKYLQFIDSSD